MSSLSHVLMKYISLFRVQVSFVGKLGASREKVQVFLGAFYGHPAIPGGEALPPVTLKSLESKMLSEYYRAKDKLVSSLALYTSVVNKSSDAAQVKQHEDLVAASNQACFKLQVRLARLRNFLRHYRASSGCAWSGERVFELKEEAGRALLVDVASSQLCKTIGCLVDTLLVLSLNATPAVAAARGKGSADDVPAAVSSSPPPPSYLSEEDCSLLFMTLCVQGIPKLHARSCALLVTLCGSQPWWGSFVTGAVTSLYSMAQTTVFHKERYSGAVKCIFIGGSCCISLKFSGQVEPCPDLSTCRDVGTCSVCKYICVCVCVHVHMYTCTCN